MSAAGVTAAPPGQPPTIDLRLAPAAIAVWAVTLAGLFLGWRFALVVAVLTLAAAPLVWRRASARPQARGLLAVLVMGSVAALGIAARTHQLEQHPLRSAAAHHGRATVRVVLEEAPKPLRGATYG